MAIRSYSPKERLRSERVGIVLFNHLGSTAATDSGGDAANIANQLGMHVIAVDRPGSGWTLPIYGGRSSVNYIGAMSRLLAKKVQPEMQAIGVGEVIIFGRSAGGYGALSATRTEQLPALGAHAQEPIGWHSTPFAKGNIAFRAYQSHERQRRDAEPDLIRGEPNGLTGWAKFWHERGNNVCGALDVINNQALWRQPSSYGNALAVAQGQPGVRLDILFAEDTYVLSGQDPGVLQDEFSTARAANSGDLQPIRVEAIPHTTHGSFDNRTFSASLLLARTVTPLLSSAG